MKKKKLNENFEIKQKHRYFVQFYESTDKR